MTKDLKYNEKIPSPYNSYNIFYILERERIIQERNGKQPTRESSSTEFSWYGPLDLPPLPPRYHHLESILVPNWYIPGARKLAKRKHVKSHGVASFKEISRIAADNWKTIDRTTQHYVQDVANILKKRHLEITQELQQQQQQGMGRSEVRPNNSWSQPPTVWQGMGQLLHQPTPSPVVVNHFHQVMGALPESNFAPLPLPYCGTCDYSDLHEPIASTLTPTTSSQHTTTRTNRVPSQENFSDQYLLEMYLKIAASVSQHDAIPPSECSNTSDQTFFCGECTH